MKYQVHNKEKYLLNIVLSKETKIWMANISKMKKENKGKIKRKAKTRDLCVKSFTKALKLSSKILLAIICT